MRSILLVPCIAIGCNTPTHPATDAPTAVDGKRFDDAPVTTCSSAPGSASISTSGGGVASTYGRVYAGALWLVGPLRRSGAPMQIRLVFTDAAQADQQLLSCCEADDACCTTDSLVADTAAIAAGSEVGAHVVTFAKTATSTFSVAGTVTITEFVDPFDALPGHITGSVSASDGGMTVDGTFANPFCPPFLSATI